MHAQAFGDEFFPSVRILRLRGIGVPLPERDHVSLGLEIFRIDTGGRRVQITLDSVFTRGLQGVNIYQGVVMKDLGVMRGYKAHSAHVRGQRIDFIDSLGGLQAILAESKVQGKKLVGIGRTELRLLNVDAAHPVPASL